eukprot:TRINITY_DN106015_c0_g1_i1.p1 TRINITY_DN106015_c0_g1~~TRINITY_DN106015_c0_g1_i1.p1  ORF type:complete len:413 (+),score=52.70 TRINITY_DN106015_c0_g1_i1:111-1241(+)
MQAAASESFLTPCIRSPRSDPASWSTPAGQSSRNASRSRLSSGSTVCGHSLFFGEALAASPATASTRSPGSERLGFFDNSPLASPRVLLKSQARLDPAQQLSPAGSSSSLNACRQNHFNTPSGPTRAPMRHFGFERRMKRSISCPPTDPLAFRNCEPMAGPLTRSMRRMGYSSSAAVATWNIAAAAAAEAEAMSRCRRSPSAPTSPRAAAGPAPETPDTRGVCIVPGLSTGPADVSSEVVDHASSNVEARSQEAGAPLLPCRMQRFQPCNETLPAAGGDGSHESPGGQETSTPRLTQRHAEAMPRTPRTPRSSARTAAPKRNPTYRTSTNMRHCMYPEAVDAGKKPLRLFRDPLRGEQQSKVAERFNGRFQLVSAS